MVSVRRRRPWGRAGKSRIGCLLTLLFLIVGSYYGYNLGAVYMRYWRFKEAIKSEARLAPSIDNATIRRRLREKVTQLRLPDEARDIFIQRTLRPRQIVIRTSYQESVDLPFFNHTFTLTPEVRNPL